MYASLQRRSQKKSYKTLIMYIFSELINNLDPIGQIFIILLREHLPIQVAGRLSALFTEHAEVNNVVVVYHLTIVAI